MSANYKSGKERKNKTKLVLYILGVIMCKGCNENGLPGSLLFAWLFGEWTSWSELYERILLVGSLFSFPISDKSWCMIESNKSGGFKVVLFFLFEPRIEPWDNEENEDDDEDEDDDGDDEDFDWDFLRSDFSLVPYKMSVHSFR